MSSKLVGPDQPCPPSTSLELPPTETPTSLAGDRRGTFPPYRACSSPAQPTTSPAEASALPALVTESRSPCLGESAVAVSSAPL
eukprot:CAMPEP_0172582500 /NCGR_PEP_ID=MMETSP1068-20121228/1938_1 /TAXON_ID=35684 /ORGANISM="Pseudopedinella elastica, Strain CCMP716" /LENGTH=83 /DNA_ID=CAMNT_0013375881 /DNA_START=192 /DNA_END=440 /DNA_ORIENTATION=+